MASLRWTYTGLTGVCILVTRSLSAHAGARANTQDRTHADQGIPDIPAPLVPAMAQRTIAQAVPGHIRTGNRCQARLCIKGRAVDSCSVLGYVGPGNVPGFPHGRVAHNQHKQ